MQNSNNSQVPESSELGKKSEYNPIYNPEILFEIPRKSKRDEINIDSDALPFYGFDLWNHYEVSWLNEKGKPMVALAKILYACTSPNIIESKSMKLYFNSFNNTKFSSIDQVEKIIAKDLSIKVGSDVRIALIPLNKYVNNMQQSFTGKCLDDLDIECTDYTVKTAFLKTNEELVQAETIYSDLLKSNCLVTNQPDWGSVQIKYSGRKIDEAGLLRYIVSFRNHNEFHEQCIERIFTDIMQHCHPTELTVHGCYTRRGGLDINPVRSTNKNILDQINWDLRLCRQ